MVSILPLDRHVPAERRRFIRFPFSLYQKDPNWVPPLNRSQHALLMDRNPFFEHADMQLFLAVRDGRDVGRIAAIENRLHNDVHEDRVGFVGFFECEQDPEAARGLFSKAASWLRARGLDVMRGPVNLSTNHTVGLLVGGEPGAPMIDMMYNPPYYEELFKAEGFEKVMDAVAHVMDVRTPATMERLKRLCERVEAKQGVTTRALNMRRFSQEVNLLLELYNSAWEQNWGFVPLTEREFRHIAEDFRTVVDPGLVRFVCVDGQVVGCLVAVLNIHELLPALQGRLWPWGWLRILTGREKIKSIRLMLLGVKSGFRLRGLEAVLYYQALQYAQAKGYTLCENSWLLENNLPVIQASEFMGGREYRRYRIFDKSLVQTDRSMHHG